MPRARQASARTWRARAWLFLQLVTLALLVAPGPAAAREYVGRVVGVTDGDTIKLLIDGKSEIRVRLAQVDAPESRQPYGSSAKQELSRLVYGKTVRAIVTDVDRYGRAVADVSVGGRDVNAEMVSRGAAWVFRRYSNDPTLVAREREARLAKRGLWGLQPDQIVAPWDWRNGGRVAAPPATRATGQITCGAKRSCRAMTSCAEAVQYLRQCNLGNLDRDGDGKPCEKLCR